MNLLALLVTFTFHLPAFNVADSCLEAFTPLDDLESCFVYQQVRYQPPRVFVRSYVRGMEGLPLSFAAPDALAVYYVVTTDAHGNRSCPSAIVQVGGSVSVPPAPAPPPVAAEVWFDVQGRRVTSLDTPGVYHSSRGRRRVTF